MTGILNLLAGAVGVVKDTYFNLVTLLLPGDGTNGAQNNTFLDSSSNNFTITRNGGNPGMTQGTFSPFSQTGWGNYFNGSTDYFTVASNAAFTLGSSGDFTVEAWVYLNATPSQYTPIATTWSNTGGAFSNRWNLSFDSTGKLVWYDSAGNLGITDAVALSLNTWHHVAVVRSGSTITMYKNGVSVGTQTTNQAYTTQAALSYGFVSGSGYLNGYISNLRVVKGTAVYTAAFTPPTSPLTAITNTQLLTCQSNRFVDNSTNAFAITVNGTPSVQAFSPFAPTAAYSAATNGGSGYFDGTGDYLSAASNTAFAFGTGDFTWEAWVYRAASATSQELYTTMVTNGFIVYISSNKAVVRQFGVADRITSSADVTLNTWTHIAVARSGTTMSLWLNGSRTNGGTATNSNDFAQSGIRIGINDVGTSAFTGYISGMRVVKGTAVYDPTQTSITVPTAPPTAITNTQLLCNFTNAGITDATAKNVLDTVGNAQISTTQSKFGGSSMYFDGTGDYLIGANSKLYAFQSSNFTIEMWIYPTTVSGVQYLFDTRDPASSTSAGVQWAINAAKATVYVGQTAVIASSTSSVSANTWTHVALVKNGSTWTYYINGVADATTGTNSTALTTEFLTIATGSTQRNTAATDKFNGYIDDLRVTNFARYTSNFTPPTQAFALQ